MSVFAISYFHSLSNAHDHRWGCSVNYQKLWSNQRFGSASSSLQQSGTINLSLLALFYSHSWTRGTWSPLLGIATHSQCDGSNPWQTTNFHRLHSLVQTTLAHAAGHTLMKQKAILRSPNRILSSPRLCLDILSTKITNRIGDKGEHWWRPTATGNMFDSLLKIQYLQQVSI